MAGNSLINRLSLYIQSGFYVAAGANHFLNADFYYPLIPDYLPWHTFINFGSGILEIGLGLLILTSKYKKKAAIGIICMLFAFIPSHVYFISEGNCVASLCVPSWLGWSRLLIIHPLLIFWAYNHKNE